VHPQAGQKGARKDNLDTEMAGEYRYLAPNDQAEFARAAPAGWRRLQARRIRCARLNLRMRLHQHEGGGELAEAKLNVVVRRLVAHGLGMAVSRYW